MPYMTQRTSPPLRLHVAASLPRGRGWHASARNACVACCAVGSAAALVGCAVVSLV